MKTQHTPGPWTDTGHDGKRNELVKSQTGTICAVWDTGRVDSQKANARLIAAAPDMLAALQLAIGCLKCHMQDCQRDGLPNAAASAERAVNATLAALAKAEGAA